MTAQQERFPVPVITDTESPASAGLSVSYKFCLSYVLGKIVFLPVAEIALRRLDVEVDAVLFKHVGSLRAFTRDVWRHVQPVVLGQILDEVLQELLSTIAALFVLASNTYLPSRLSV